MKHKVGKGHFELEMPADWSLVETGEYFEGQVHEDLKSTYSIRNAKGSEMAVLSTGIEYYAHGEPPMTQVHNEIIDFSDKAVNGQSYVFATSKGSTGTSISLAMGKKNQLEAADALPWVFSPSQSSSATFYRVIEDDQQLTGVDPSLTGAARARAYAKTEEYKQLKSVMLSLKEIKKFTAPPLGEASTERPPASAQSTPTSWGIPSSAAMRRRLSCSGCCKSARAPAGWRSSVSAPACWLWKGSPVSAWLIRPEDVSNSA